MFICLPSILFEKRKKHEDTHAHTRIHFETTQLIWKSHKHTYMHRHSHRHRHKQMWNVCCKRAFALCTKRRMVEEAVEQRWRRSMSNEEANALTVHDTDKKERNDHISWYLVIHVNGTHNTGAHVRFVPSIVFQVFWYLVFNKSAAIQQHNNVWNHLNVYCRKHGNDVKKIAIFIQKNDWMAVTNNHWRNENISEAKREKKIGEKREKIKENQQKHLITRCINCVTI